ncbi:MAG TPA: hypothetical protein VGX92_07360 [Pyrinomonadaceae bacterium]|nr:hypothetical protein [Pyrinomonadaceae bacterium]
MKTVHKRLIVLALMVALAGFPFVQTGAQSKSRRARRLQREAPGSTLLFSIPVGGQGIHYKGVGLEEIETWGPSSFRVAPDGTFLITDTVTNRVLIYDREGRLLRQFRPANVDGITDAVTDENNVYVLDGAAPDPAIITLQRSGREMRRSPVKPELRRRGVSGLSVGESGGALLELQGGATVLSNENPPGRQPMRARSAGGRNYSVTIADQGGGAQGPSEGTVKLDGKTVATISVENTLGGLTVLASTPDGDFYVLVEELTSAPNIMIDQTVRHYEADGMLAGIARVPIAERFTYVSHGVAVGPDRNVYALITRPQRADVIQLEFNVSLPQILPARPAALPHPPVGAAPCRRRRSEITELADRYVNSSTVLNVANLTGPCTYRQRPTYLNTTAGSYVSVPYDWGGFDSISDYQSLMATVGGNYRAGDRKESNEPSNYTASCSRGVDCSGFVSRCWGLTAKESTSSLPNISFVIAATDLQPGDILNKAGKHVVIFDKRATNPTGGPEQGIYTWEATQTNKFDRVVHHWWPWSRFRDYLPRRYTRLCP